MNHINEIKVSVCIVTYNHESYLIACLDSLVKQEVNFPYEIIVGEDFSTDRTRNIVLDYYERYPDLIIPILHEKNVGPLENIRQVYAKARGKYIAHVDGDDIPLPDKLQKQFDALESNQDCSICSHDMQNIDENGLLTQFQNWKYPAGIYTLFDLYHSMPFFAHSSKMFRNEISAEEWETLFSNPYILDMDIHFLNLQYGKIVHLNESLGQYRVNVGMSNVGKKVNPLLPQGAIRIFEKGLDYYKYDDEKIGRLKKLYASAMLQCAYNYAVYDGDIEKFRDFVEKSLIQNKISLTQVGFVIFSIFPSIFFPILKKRAKSRGL